MKKLFKYSLIGCNVVIIVIFLLLLLLIAMLFYAIGSSSTSVPESVMYRDAKDLYRISNVQFPAVMLVDSLQYDDFTLSMTTAKYVLAEPDKKTVLMERIKEVLNKDSVYWENIDNKQFKYYILPEFPIDRPNGTGWRKTENGVEDWDGEFIRMTIREDNDTIIIQYGWCK